MLGRPFGFECDQARGIVAAINLIYFGLTGLITFGLTMAHSKIVIIESSSSFCLFCVCSHHLPLRQMVVKWWRRDARLLIASSGFRPDRSNCQNVTDADKVDLLVMKCVVVCVPICQGVRNQTRSICPLTLPFFLCTKSLASVAPLLCAPFLCCHLIFVISTEYCRALSLTLPLAFDSLRLPQSRKGELCLVRKSGVMAAVSVG